MNLQYPQFYKPDPNNPTVYDQNNKPVSMDEYLYATQQVGVDPKKINWSYVKNGSPAVAQASQTLSSVFTPEQIASMPDDMKVGFAAFWDTQQNALNKGGVAANDINQQTWNEAMSAAEKDPMILQKYGEGLKVASQNLQTNLGLITGQFTQEQAKQQRDMLQQQKDLAEQEAAAGRAYSGFRKQAEDRLAADQNDIIQSSRRQLQQSLQSTVAPFESRFGSDQLQKTLGTQNPGVQGAALYNPYTGLQGTESGAKKADVLNKAQSLYPIGLNPAQ